MQAAEVEPLYRLDLSLIPESVSAHSSLRESVVGEEARPDLGGESVSVAGKRL